MPQTGDPSAAAVRLQSHSAVIDEVGLGDGSIAGIERKHERQRGSGPFSCVNFGNILLHELGFIVAVGQSAIPKRRAVGNNEGGILVWCPCGVFFTGNDVAIGNAIIEYADLKSIRSETQVMRERKFDAVALIDRCAMGPVPRIRFVYGVAFDIVEYNSR